MNRTELINKVKEYKDKLKLATSELKDEIAVQVAALFPEWEASLNYKKGERIRYNNILYTVLTPHLSQSDWTPDAAASLYAKVLTDETEILPWEQPDSTNGYKKDDKVIHNEKIWISLVDNNIWEPGVVGTLTLWAEVK